MPQAAREIKEMEGKYNHFRSISFISFISLISLALLRRRVGDIVPDNALTINVFSIRKITPDTTATALHR